VYNQVAKLGNSKDSKTNVNLFHGRWSIERVVDEISNSCTHSPVVTRVLEDVEEGHGSMAETMNEQSFEFTLDKVSYPSNQSESSKVEDDKKWMSWRKNEEEEGTKDSVDILLNLADCVGMSAIDERWLEIKEGIDQEWTQILNKEHLRRKRKRKTMRKNIREGIHSKVPKGKERKEGKSSKSSYSFPSDLRSKITEDDGILKWTRREEQDGSQNHVHVVIKKKFRQFRHTSVIKLIVSNILSFSESHWWCS
jgi:hypothetical protein